MLYLETNLGTSEGDGGTIFLDSEGLGGQLAVKNGTISENLYSLGTGICDSGSELQLIDRFDTA